MRKASGQLLPFVFWTLPIAGAIAALSGPAALAQDGSHVAVASATLPHDLTPWGMFVAADALVKAVMIGLGCASIVTWTVWLAKTIELRAAKRRVRVELFALLESRSLPDAVLRIDASEGPAREMLTAAIAEFNQSAGAPSLTGLRDRIASRLERIEAASNRSIARGIGVLATIGATAPFVGLFGTVWGIMDSFIGISKAHATNLAIVAPGIAEALLATAFGLAAAIPAVVIYNVFSRAIAGYRLVLGDLSAAVLRLASRDLDWQDPRTPVKRSPARVAEAAE